MARPERLELPPLWFEAGCSDPPSYGRAAYSIDFGTVRQYLARQCDVVRARELLELDRALRRGVVASFH